MAEHGYHEPYTELSQETRSIHRAVVTLIEEFEAVDWYRQRTDATEASDLAEIMTHNMNEELEHAAMTLEWLRRTIPHLDAMLRRYLFTEGSIADRERAGPPEPAVSDGSLGMIGRVHHEEAS